MIQSVEISKYNAQINEPYVNQLFKNINKNNNVFYKFN